MASESNDRYDFEAVKSLDHPSICHRLFGKNEQPQQEESTGVEKLTSCKDSSLTSLSTLDMMNKLTRRIEDLIIDQSEHQSQLPDQRKLTIAMEMASLYSQRAAFLLDFVDYDATAVVPLSLIRQFPEQDEANQQPQNQEHEQHQNMHTISGVQQALDDAKAAFALNPESVEGYVLAAQCSRSLGNTAEAKEFLRIAALLAQDNAQVQQLMEQLAVDECHDRLPSFSNELLSTAHTLLAINDAHSDIMDSQHKLKYQERERIADDNVACNAQSTFQSLHALLEAPWLIKMEQTMHHNVHHQCALVEDVHQLNKAYIDATAMIYNILREDAVMTTLELNQKSVENMAPTTSTNGVVIHEHVENRTIRRWITQTLAPAVQRFLSTQLQAARSSKPIPSGSQGEQVDRNSALIMLLRDALMVFTHILYAMATWRRCTSMPHALGYTETCYDLAKELHLGNYEMVCADAYAVALLELTTEHNDALVLHQQSLDATIFSRDERYELRCHHHIGKAHMRMQDFHLAEKEFQQLLQQSQAMGDTQMECLAHCELGECFMQRGTDQKHIAQAQVHFKHAQTLCNQTAHGLNTWRKQSIQHAIEFYAAMQPSRRGAIRISLDTDGEDENSQNAQANLSYNGLWGDFKKEDEQAPAFVLASSTAKLDDTEHAPQKSRRRIGWRDSVFTALPSSVSSISSSTSFSSSISSPNEVASSSNCQEL